MKTLLFLASLILSLPVAAQSITATNFSTESPVIPNQTPAASDWTESIKRVIAMNPDAFSATNWTVAVAPSYAPGLKDADGDLREFGVTAALLYPLGQFVYAGARLDYIAGDFFLPSVGVELKADIKLFQKLEVTPFAVTGVSYAVTDDTATDGEVGAIYGAGVKMHLLTIKGVRLGGFGSWERWTQWPDVDVFHAGVTASFSF